jgi:hypothetical protein
MVLFIVFTVIIILPFLVSYRDQEESEQTYGCHHHHFRDYTMHAVTKHLELGIEIL